MFKFLQRIIKGKPQKFPANNDAAILGVIQKIALQDGLTITQNQVRIKDQKIKIILNSSLERANKIEIFIEKCRLLFPKHTIIYVQEVSGNQTDQHCSVKSHGSHDAGIFDDASSKKPIKPSKSSRKHDIPDDIRPKNFKKIILVASGKGGVGKSSVSFNLALAFKKMGLKTAYIDCDIYGPSAPIMTGAYHKAVYQDGLLQPIDYEGMQTMSIGFMIEKSQALVWRGPMVSGAIGQIFMQTAWRDADIAVVDLPPGTGDAQLTLCQNLRPDGVVIVTQPQLMSVVDAERCLSMFEKLSISILGVVENMCGFKAPDTGKVYYIFGRGGGKSLAENKNCPFLGELPFVPMLAYNLDQGINAMESAECIEFTQEIDKIAGMLAHSKNLASV